MILGNQKLNNNEAIHKNHYLLRADLCLGQSVGLKVERSESLTRYHQGTRNKTHIFMKIYPHTAVSGMAKRRQVEWCDAADLESN